MKESKRYYFWEKIPYHGIRQMGRMDGYESTEQLKWECRHAIEINTAHGYPTWIMESTFYEVLIPESED